MTFISLDLFSGKGKSVISIPVPVVSLNDYHNRLSRFVIKRIRHEASIGNKHNIVCREIFQTDQKEIFLLPSFRGKNVSLESVLPGKLFFLRGVYSWNFILIFLPEENSKGVFYFTQPASFTQEKTYPEGASSATSFLLSSSCASILVSEHGCIEQDGEGKLFLQGITVSVLQNLSNKSKSIFVKRRDIFASPKSPLREEDLSSLEPRSCKFIKISCFCRQKDFVYSTHFPVLTPEEVQEKLKNNREKRLKKYGARSVKYTVSDREQRETKTNKSHSLLIVLPAMMEVNVPFGSCEELFFSYSDQSLLTLQLIFFPYLFNLNQLIPKKVQQCAKNWRIGNAEPLVRCCNLTSATIFSVPGLKLVPFSEYEYKITGEMKVEFVSAPRGNCWGIFCSPEEEMPLSASASMGAKSIDSPVPGTSGLGRREPAARLAQPTATISSPPKKQDQHTEQSGRSSPLPGSSGIGCREATASLSQAEATVAVSKVIRNPVPRPSGMENLGTTTQAAATVFVPPGGQGKQTQKRKMSVSVPYSYLGTESFVGGLYPYGSPYPPYPHPSVRQDQLLPVLPSFASTFRPPVAALEPLRYDISVQEIVGHSGRAEEASASIPVRSVQQTPIWSPDEDSSSAEVSPQAQAEKSDEDTDIDVDN